MLSYPYQSIGKQQTNNLEYNNMEAYKFQTTIQANGIIQIPEISQFAHRDVDIFILLKPQPTPPRLDPEAIQMFLRQLQGILKDVPPDELDSLKEQYLQEKYQ
jgi:hypothetical protein